jgi:hypothetical protein
VRHNIKRVVGLLLTAVGIVTSLVAVFSVQLGIDREPDWGPARVFLLIVGILLAITPLSEVLTRPLRSLLKNSAEVGAFRGLTRKFQEGFWVGRPGAYAQHGQPGDHPDVRTRKRNIRLFAVIVFVISIVTSIWLISAGRWTQWINNTDYYHLQAKGFRAGHTYLPVEPSAELLELQNPYPYEARKNIPHLWDASLYDGKYYLYWGPTPALLILLAESLPTAAIGDSILVFIFSAMTTAFSLSILKEIWIYRFKRLRAWTFLVPAFAVAFANPLPWLMGRPAVYEAAIASGQAFFIGGLFWVVREICHPGRRSAHFLLSGIFWGFALASRITLVPAVLGLSVIFALRAVTKPGPQHQEKKLVPILALCIPLVLALGGLGAYNLVRFGAPLEFGHRYQLSSAVVPAVYGEFFSPKNILTNLFNYAVNPPRILSVFPFIKPHWGQNSVPMLRSNAAPGYHSEQITGILLTTPFVLLSFIPIAVWLRNAWKNIGGSRKTRVEPLLISLADWKWIYTLMLGSAVLLMSPLLILNYASMRYMLDFNIVLVLSSGVALGGMIAASRTNFTHSMVLIFGILTCICSVVVSLLLAITGYNSHFEHLNPQLFDALSRFFAF